MASDDDERKSREAERPGQSEQEVAEEMLEQAEGRAEADDPQDEFPGGHESAADWDDIGFSGSKTVWEKRKQIHSKQSSTEFTIQDIKDWFTKLLRRGKKAGSS